MTPEQLKKYLPNASPSFLKLNSDLPGRLQDPIRKPASLSPLVKSPRIRPSRKSRVVAIVTIIALRRGLADDDNLSAGAKTLRDCVAASLGVDDGDRRVKWEYAVAQTSGPEQTLVKICLL